MKGELQSFVAEDSGLSGITLADYWKVYVAFSTLMSVADLEGVQKARVSPYFWARVHSIGVTPNIFGVRFIIVQRTSARSFYR